MLLLKRHLADLVRAGKKRQTIRLWDRPLVRPGQISFSPGLGRLRITAVDELDSLDALTESDAHADGFASLADLLAELRTIYAPPPAANHHHHYPNIAGKGDHRIYRVRFDWPLASHHQDAPKSARTPPRTPETKSKTKSPPRKSARPAPSEKSRRKSAPAATLVTSTARTPRKTKTRRPPKTARPHR